MAREQSIKERFLTELRPKFAQSIETPDLLVFVCDSLGDPLLVEECTQRLSENDPHPVISFWRYLNVFVQESATVSNQIPPELHSQYIELQNLLQSFEMRVAYAWMLTEDNLLHLTNPNIAAGIAVFLPRAAESFELSEEDLRARVDFLLTKPATFIGHMDKPEDAIAMVELAEDMAKTTGEPRLISNFLQRFEQERESTKWRLEKSLTRSETPISVDTAVTACRVLQVLGFGEEKTGQLVDSYFAVATPSIRIRTGIDVKDSLSGQTYCFQEALPAVVQLYGPKRRPEALAKLHEIGITRKIAIATILARLGKLSPEFAQAAIDVGLIDTGYVEWARDQITRVIDHDMIRKPGGDDLKIEIGEDQIRSSVIAAEFTELQNILATMDIFGINMTTSGPDVIRPYVKILNIVHGSDRIKRQGLLSQTLHLCQQYAIDESVVRAAMRRLN